MQPPAVRVKDLIDQLLDRQYFGAVDATLNAIETNATTGLMGQRLAALRVEAGRLASLGQSLSPDNAVYAAFRSDLDRFVQSSAFLVDGQAATVQQLGIQAADTLTRGLAFGDVNDEQLRLIGVDWNRPDPDAVNALVNYVQSPEWQASLQKFQGYIPDVVQNTIVRGFVSGRGPLDVVEDLLLVMQHLPRSQANSLLRTAQLTSYRDSTVMQQVANADIIDHIIRIAALDHRTCLGCIALHGTRLEVGERVDDHRQGRCTSLTIIKGRPRLVGTGEQWLNSLSPDQQRQTMGDANYNAWADGAVQLRDFAQKGSDPIFGPTIQEASLKGLLGDGAEKYYKRNQ